MGLLGKMLGRSGGASGATSSADKLAKEYMAAHGNVTLERYNEMSEDLIELAIWYWEKGDFESYKVLKHAADEIAFLYRGGKYPQGLVEDIIVNQRGEFGSRQ